MSDVISFEIVFDPDPDESGTYGVATHVMPTDQRSTTEFVSPFAREELAEALEWMERGRLSDDAAREFGLRLFEALFTGKLRSIYDEHAGVAARVRYRFVLQSPEIAAVPWELIFDPVRERFLSDISPVVRNLAVTESARPLKVDEGLRILVVDAFPEGFEPLESQTEAAAIKKALLRMRFREQARVDVLTHATRERLATTLSDAANARPPRPYHILHFIGHGEVDPVTGKTSLLFENGDQQADPVGPEDLVRDIADHKFSIVFLNACESLNASAFETTGGFAPALLGAGIPAVIGMQLAILDRVASKFTRVFYQALADGDPVDSAVTAARRAVGSDKGGRQAHMGIPVVYLRTQDGRLFDVAPPPRLSREQAGPWLRHQLRPRRLVSNVWALVVAAAVVVGLFTGGVVIKERYIDDPPPMTGDFNVAVAAFGEVDETGEVVDSSEGFAHADSLHRQLEDAIAAFDFESFDIDIRGPGDVGSLKGSTQAARAEQAADIAETIQSDLIIYGTIDAADTGSFFEPEFYLSPNRLGADGGSFAGQYGLGSPIEVEGDVYESSHRDTLRARLISRAGALAQFVVGITRYTQRRFDLAASHFQAAADAPGWDRRDGKELVYVFLGNAQGKIGELPSARTSYEEALILEPEYARGYLGLAEVLFVGAQPEGCEADVDVEGMVEAAATYDLAQDATIRPASGEMPARVAFGKARVYTCLYSSGVAALNSGAISEDDLLEAARDEYRTVINTSEEPTGRIQDMAAEAHAGLGLTYLLDLGDDPFESYRLAAASYEDAVALARDPERKAGFLRFLGFISDRLDQCAAAVAFYDEAIAETDDADLRRLFAEERAQIQQRIDAGSC